MLDDELEEAIDALCSEIKSANRRMSIVERELKLMREEKSRRQKGYYLPLHDKNMIEFELTLVKPPRRIA